MHHAYLYEGSQELLTDLVADARKAFGFQGEHNPDVSVMSFEKFGVEEAAQFRAKAHLRSVSGRALAVVGVASITTEAQQSLLKLFEEPQEGTLFVLLTPHGTLLPTLRSRFLTYPKELEGKNSISVHTFLAMGQKERSLEIAVMLKDDEGVKERVRDFLDALERTLAPRISKSAEVRHAVEDILKVRSYLGDRSPSLKMLLEHLALSLPQQLS